jgi:hypothetical protein
MTLELHPALNAALNGTCAILDPAASRSRVARSIVCKLMVAAFATRRCS